MITTAVASDSMKKLFDYSKVITHDFDTHSFSSIDSQFTSKMDPINSIGGIFSYLNKQDFKT